MTSSDSPVFESTASTGKLFIVFFSIAAVAYVVVLGGISHGQLLYGVPTYEDDYRTLAYSLGNIPIIACRPIAFYTSFLMGSFGATFTYLCAQVMAVATIALSFTLVACYLEVKRLYWPSVLVALVSAVSVENLADYSRYLAGLFGLYSSVLGLTALICFVRAFRADRPQKFLMPAIVLTVLGLLCKEEFFGPIICFCLWSSLPVFGEKNRHLARITAISLICVCAAILAFEKFILHSPFLGSGVAYSISWSPASILGAYWSYLTNCPGTKIAAAANISAILFSIVMCGRQTTIRVTAIAALSLLIMAPFSLIPQHFLEIYTFEWTSLQCASLLVLCCIDKTKLRHQTQTSVKTPLSVQTLLCVFLLALIPAIIFVTNPLRVAKFAWHDKRGAFNSKVIAWLSAHRNELNKHKLVAVTGLPLGSPWYGNDGAFLKNKLGLNCSWLVVTPKNSDLYKAQLACAALKCGSIEVKAIDAAALESGVPEAVSVVPELKGRGIPLIHVKEDGTVDFKSNLAEDMNDAKN